MAFLKADINLRLLLLILVVLAVFVGSNIYYQNYINGLQAEYDKKVEHLKEIEKKLLLKEEKLNEVYELKGLLEEDKEILETGYISLLGENQNLKIEKASLVEDLDAKPFGKLVCKATGNVRCSN